MPEGSDAGEVDATSLRGEDEEIGTALKAGGSSGFNALLTGYRAYIIESGVDRWFHECGDSASFWSATAPVGASLAYVRYLKKYDENKMVDSSTGVHRTYFNKSYGISVRCLMD